MLHALAFVVCSLAAPLPHDPEGRLAVVSARIQANPLAAGLYVERAQLFAAMRAPEQALLDFERAAALAPNLLAALVGRAEMLVVLQRQAEALACLDLAVVLGEPSARLQWLRGQVLAQLGRDAAAVAVFTGALDRLAPPRPEHFLELAATLAGEAGAGGRQLAVLQRGIDELGPAPALVTAAVECDLRVGAFDRALARVDALRAHAERQAPWWLCRADILDRAGRTSEAVAARAAAAAASEQLAAHDRAQPPWFGPPPPPAETKVFVARGATWRYRDDNSQTGTAWAQPWFDDSSWPVGPAQLGYGDGDEATVVGFGASTTNRHITTWFRRTFIAAVDTPLTWAAVRLLRDDGAVVWFDGVELVRSNMPAGTIGRSTLASVATPDENHWFDYFIDPSLLRSGEHTIAVEIHQAAPNSSDISFDLELVAGTGSTLITRDPYLQNGSHDGAVVRWRTGTPTTSALWLGSSPSNLQLAYSSSNVVTEHTAVVRGLPPESLWFYAVGDLGGVLAGGDQEHRFKTLPQPGQVRPLRTWVLGDSGTGLPTQYAVRDQFLQFAGARPADAILMLGDNAYQSGTDPEYQVGLFEVYRDTIKNTFLWPSLGNHDALSADSQTETGPYYQIFDLPRAGEAGGLPSGTEAYYSFDRGHVHFVCLDSQDTDRTATGAMMQWLQADLASTAAPWVVAYFHHPPYTKGSHDSDDAGDSGGRMRDMRQVALPILEQHGVDLVLAGHSHNYERSFLLDGHYGVSSTLLPAMILDAGDGRADGDGSYAKTAAGRGAHDGAVYVVAGSAGSSGGGTLDHPGMFVSMSDAGSLVLDFDGHRLDATFVTSLGTVADRFTMAKNTVRALRRDVPALSVGAGGTQQFTLRAGPQHANLSYGLAGALGSTPGITYGGLQVPLNDDLWLDISIRARNSAAYPGSFGTLDANGEASCALVVPPGALAAGAGLSLYHAFVVFGPTGPVLASNAVRLRLVP